MFKKFFIISLDLFYNIFENMQDKSIIVINNQISILFF